MEIVLDETRSYSLIAQRLRLETFITQMLQVSVSSKERSFRSQSTSKRSLANISNTRKKSTNQSLSTTSLLSSRLVKSKEICTTHSSRNNIADDNNKASKNLNAAPNSPFTSAFLESVSAPAINLANTKHSMPTVIQAGSKTNDNHLDISYNMPAMPWTRTRVRALESEIRSMATMSDKNHNISSTSAGDGINVTKSMLSNAQFISQVDKKFIIVKMDGILCAIDQHAADERIGLERLEKALLHKISKNTDNYHESNDAKDDQSFSVDLSKKKNISSNDLFKFVHLKQPKHIQLSSTQLHTIKCNREIINNWRFDFTLANRNGEQSELRLLSVPGVCGKVATVNDFVQFLQMLEGRSGAGGDSLLLVKPAFVKRVLSSYACRYAIMFGDSLTENECIKMISDLAICDFSFICAHGRPSVVPLIDLKTL